MSVPTLVRAVEEAQLRDDRPELEPGDSVRVHVKVVEGTRERIQVFEGRVIRVTGGGLRRNVTVRRVTHGVGVERTFLVHSPRIDRIEVMRHGRVRQARLYYLRGRVGKAARIRERRDEGTGSKAEALRAKAARGRGETAAEEDEEEAP